MLWRFFALCIVCMEVLFADTALSEFDSNNNKIFELFADNIDSIDYKTMIATGNAVIVSQDMYMIADYIKYDTKSREANASGNVKFYRDGTMFFSAQQANIKFDENYFAIEPFYMQDSKSGMWISASFAENKDKDYYLRDIVVSGCDIDSPIWHIEGTSGDYNEDSAIAGIWNPRIYIKQIPILYLPYIFVSTHNKRTTGLLYPEFASSSQEGFIYLQPFFLALQDFWDMTFSPQIRTSRGYGIYTQARLVDINNKMFMFNMGIFQNFKKYKQRYDAQNLTIFGFDFSHERRNLLSEFIGFDSDGLYLDFNYMNDLDYIRLQSTKNTTIENRIQTSKANYFGTIDNSHYLGLYFKYFLDLSNVSNNETMQTLPHFQYHRYLEQTDVKNISYSVDVNSKNTINGSKFGYINNNVKIPLYVQTPILSGYFVVGANADINVNVINVYNAHKQPLGYNYKNGNSSYFGLNYGLFVNSDVAKQYDKIFHSMSFGAVFSSPLYEYSDDENRIFSTNQDGVTGVLSNVVQNNQQIQLKFSQYFFGLNAVELVYHRMYQDINLQDRQNKLGSLRNELGFSPISNIDVMTTLYYSWFNKTIEEASLSLNTYAGYFKANLTYYLKKTFNYTDSNRLKYAEESANFLRAKLSYDFGYFAVYGDIGYDFNRKYIRDWNFSISKDIRCFGIGFRFANELVPILTTSGASTLNNRYVSLEFRFVPVASTSVTHRFKQ